MIRRSSIFVLGALLLFATSANAQETQPTQIVSAGLWTDSFLEKVGGQAIVIAGKSSLPDVTEQFVQQTIASMYESKKFALVMDASPLGDLAELPDTERLAKAKTQDVSLACIVNAFPAPGAAKIKIKCERKDGGGIEFVGTANDGNSFFLNKTIDFPDDVIDTEFPKPTGANLLALNVLTTAKSVAFELEKRTHEGARQMLTFSPTRTEKRRIVAGVGEPIRQDVFYELIGKADLADYYRRKNNQKTTLFIVSASLLALGAGFMFVGLAANSGCDDADCRNLVIPVTGGIALGLGGIGITWGFLTKKYPTTKEEDQEFIDAYNDQL